MPPKSKAAAAAAEPVAVEDIRPSPRPPKVACARSGCARLCIASPSGSGRFRRRQVRIQPALHRPRRPPPAPDLAVSTAGKPRSRLFAAGSSLSAVGFGALRRLPTASRGRHPLLAGSGRLQRPRSPRRRPRPPRRALARLVWPSSPWPGSGHPHAAFWSLAGRRRLSFAGQRTGDDSTARLVRAAVNLRDLDISRSCWGCQITDEGLLKISSAECVGKLTSISLWGLAGITDNGVVHLVSRAHSLQNLNIGGTFITDESLYAVANCCTNLKSIILWSCRHVTEAGLVALVSKCRKLECINVGGMRVSPESFVGLLAISPALQIRSIPQILGANVQVS